MVARTRDSSFDPPRERRSSNVRIVDAAGLKTITIPFVNQYALECLAMEGLIRDGKPSLSPATDAAGTQAVIAAWKGS